MNPEFLGYSAAKYFLPNPFSTIADIILKPHISTQNKIFAIKRKIGENPYLSIHVRGFYDVTGTGTKRAFECANKLLASRRISYIYFATESLRLLKLANASVSDRSKLIIFDKDLIQDEFVHVDSYDIRQNMDDALVEWYGITSTILYLTIFTPRYSIHFLLRFLIGDADYCVSPTITSSTFSKTAVVRGSCKYIDFRKASSCSVSSAISEGEKGALMTEHYLEERSYIQKKRLSSEEREALWQSINVSQIPGKKINACKNKFYVEKFVKDYWTA